MACPGRLKESIGTPRYRGHGGSTAGVRGTSARQRSGVAIHVALVALLVPAHVLIAPVANWREPLVLAMLAAMAVVVDRHDVPLPAGIRFDALWPWP